MEGIPGTGAPRAGPVHEQRGIVEDVETDDDTYYPTQPGRLPAPGTAQVERVHLAPAETCDLCGTTPMRVMGACKFQCMVCSYLMSCHDR